MSDLIHPINQVAKISVCIGEVFGINLQLLSHHRENESHVQNGMQIPHQFRKQSACIQTNNCYVEKWIWVINFLMVLFCVHNHMEYGAWGMFLLHPTWQVLGKLNTGLISYTLPPSSSYIHRTWTHMHNYRQQMHTLIQRNTTSLIYIHDFIFSKSCPMSPSLVGIFATKPSGCDPF